MEITDLELQGRYEEVFEQYLMAAPELVKVLEKFGRIRQELGTLIDEMHKRKLPTKLEHLEEDAQKPTK